VCASGAFVFAEVNAGWCAVSATYTHVSTESYYKIVWFGQKATNIVATIRTRVVEA
jgi:hypothetical protein